MHVFLKRKYGQNFLIDKNIINKITNLVQINDLNVIEIGPGSGNLTESILKFNPKKLTIVEIDRELIPSLEKRFINFNNLEIVNKDIINFDFDNDIDLIISNLPYNISSQILVKICISKNLPSNLILMFQKEFANRLRDNKLNSLNSLVSCFYEIGVNFNVSKNCFRPIPKVESSVLLFSKKKQQLIKSYEISKFIEFKRKIFSYKRKTLKKLLKEYDLMNQDVFLNKRPEEIDLKLLIKIFRETNL